MTARERLPELLHAPFRRRVGGHVVVEDSTGAQFHDYKHIQGAECGSDHDEEVARYDLSFSEISSSRLRDDMHRTKTN